eukprot:s3768_g4.t1
MAAVEVSQEDTSRCVMCGLVYPKDGGRQHGKHFRCSQCLSVDRTIRRHLGTSKSLEEFTPEGSKDFFKTVVHSKSPEGGNLLWQTIRASLVKRLTEKQINSHASKVDVEELPLSVLLQRGWSEDTVRRFPSYESPEYGCTVFKEMILEREKQASKKRGAKAAELDVPVAGPSGTEKSSEKNEARQADTAEKKKLQSNQKIAALAAKSLGSLTTMETSLEKIIKKAEMIPEADAPALNVCQETLNTTQRWNGAAKAAVRLQDGNKEKGRRNPTRAWYPCPMT